MRLNAVCTSSVSVGRLAFERSFATTAQSARATWILCACYPATYWPSKNIRPIGAMAATMTTTNHKQKPSFGCIGLLFGCGIRPKGGNDNDIAPSKSRSPTSNITVEDDGKQNMTSAGDKQAPPSPATTAATEDASVHSTSTDDELPDDPATHTSANPATGNSGSIFRGISAMEKNIMRVLFSFLFTLLTLGLAGRSAGPGKKVITDGSSDSKSSNSCTAENPDSCSTEKKED